MKMKTAFRQAATVVALLILFALFTFGFRGLSARPTLAKPEKTSKQFNPLTALAATITVNSTAQSPGAIGDCTLGEAIIAANTDAAVDGCLAGSLTGADTIILPVGLYTLTSVNNFGFGGMGANGLPHITSPIIIQGAGATSTIIERSSAAGTPDFRIFYAVHSNAYLTLNGVTVRNGKSSGHGGAVAIHEGGDFVANDCVFLDNFVSQGYGGAIAPVVTNATITVNNSKFINNSARGAGAIGGDYQSITNSEFTNNIAVTDSGGAVGTGYYGQVNVTGSKFTGNSAAYSGGAISGGAQSQISLSNSTFTGNSQTNQFASGAGGAISGGYVTVVGSQLSNNASATSGGAISNGAAPNTFVTVTNSTLYSNSARSGGGGIEGNAVTINNSTVSGNRAGEDGGGISVFGTGSSLSLNNATITNNTADSDNNGSGSGGGIRADWGGLAGSVRNSIIAGNIASNGPDCFERFGRTAFLSQGYNIIGNNCGCSFTPASGDKVGTSQSPIDPRLGALQDNGGTTFTHDLLANSPAFDAANPITPGSNVNTCLTADQRGGSRPESAACDIGAVEKKTAPPSSKPQFNVSSYSVRESDGMATITVSRADVSNPATVEYLTSNGAAFAGSDYAAVSGALDFSAGETSKTFTVNINDDAAGEATESINLSLKEPNAPVHSTSILFIRDNDTIRLFDVSDFSVKETNSGTTSVQIPVNLTRTYSTDTDINYSTTDDTATAGSDYISQSGTLRIPANTLSGTITLSVKGDTLNEPDESFNLNLSYPVNCGGEFKQSVITISDDDNANSTPVVTNPGNQTNAENDTVNLQIAANDPDSNSLTFNATNLPPGLSINSGTGLIFGTLSYTSAGSYNIIVTVSDGSLSDSEAFTWTINNLNRAPTADSFTVTTNEDTPKAITLSGADEDGEAITFTVTNNPSHGTLSGTDANLTYTPNANFNGADSFSYAANDGSVNSAPATVSIGVSAVNDAPTVTNPGNQTNAENDTISRQINASDADNSSLTYSAAGLPDGLSINQNTGLISGTLSFTSSGTHNVSVSVSDGSLTNSISFVWTVNNTNRAPAANNANATTEEDRAVTVALEATDADGDALTYTINAHPTNGTLSGSGANLIYTPNANYNGTDSFTYRAGDGSLNSNTATVSITVTPVNDAPVLTAIGNRTVAVGSTLSFNLSATDVENEALTFAANNLPNGATLNPATGAFSWTPTAAQPGSYTVTFTVTDAGGASDSETIVINVVNFATNITVSAPAFVANGSSLTLSGVLTDASNMPLSNRTITFSIGSNNTAQNCIATTSATGSATCTISNVNQTLGPNLPVSAVFAGDGSYLPSSAQTTMLVFAYAVGNGGGFVIGDNNATVGQSVTFWGAQWANKNSLSGGGAPNSFKGFANRITTTPMSCGATWFTDPGNSSNPPITVPAYMAVIAANSITKTGSTISGNTQKIVIVETNAGYGPAPGHTGTATVVGVLCQ